MEVYGEKGYVFADREQLRFLRDASSNEIKEKVPSPAAPYNDPFLYMAAIIRGKIPADEQSLSSLGVNMIAMEILDAAKQSAKTGRVVLLKKEK